MTASVVCFALAAATCSAQTLRIGVCEMMARVIREEE
jgi:hypothetical protein